MIENKISSIIVVDDKGSLKGIFTKSDLVEVYGKYYTGKGTVKEYMSKEVLTVAPDEPIHMVLLLMTRGKVSRIVVTRDRRPIGIITGRDLLPVSTLFGEEALLGGNQETEETAMRHRKEQMFIPSGIRAYFLARDVMKYDPITIAEDFDLAEAAQLMAMNRISGLPVIDLSDNVVGIITKSDIIKAWAALS
jgi:CBS domain-containing protein